MFKFVLSILLFSQIFTSTDLYVGHSDKEGNFNTVQDAVNEAGTINPKSEEERVTIHIAPGTYRQQVVVNTPYITFINDEPKEGDAMLTWYYGIGYKYYSADENGLYDATLAEKKTSKNPAKKRWGSTVHLFSKAAYFKAENIVFENSFNRYMTEEEVDDGVEVSGETAITVQRTASLDVRSRTATERAAALSAEAPYVEFLNCRFYSSQDTLYTGASPLYFKNCIIEGMTDYIYGASNAVFDSCELRFKGYSDKAGSGVITAARGDTDEYTGYLMYNCKVTKNKVLKVDLGYFGRPWLQTAQVLFYNTVLEDDKTINKAGWTTMGGVKPEDVPGFKEYGTKYTNGGPVGTSYRKGNVLSADDVKDLDIKSYLNNWTPSYL